MAPARPCAYWNGPAGVAPWRDSHRDGQLIAVADGRSVRLWDAATGKLVRELSAGGRGRVYSVAFSPTDNRLLAVGYGGATDVSYVALWDIDAARELARLPGATDLPDFRREADPGAVGALAFSPDGKYLVAGFGRPGIIAPGLYPNQLKVWEVATRRLIRRLSGHTRLLCRPRLLQRRGSTGQRQSRWNSDPLVDRNLESDAHAPECRRGFHVFPDLCATWHG